MSVSAPASMIWTKKASKQTLFLQFDEDDDILGGIASAMADHKIGEASLLECTGHIKSGIGNYLAGNQLLTKNFDNTEIKTAVGHFKRGKGGLFGILKIIPTDLDNHVTIARAKAGPDLQIKLSYYEF